MSNFMHYLAKGSANSQTTRENALWQLGNRDGMRGSRALRASVYDAIAENADDLANYRDGLAVGSRRRDAASNKVAA